MIASTKWYLGGSSVYDTPIKFYGYERGTKVYSGRPISWIGEVGLIYPSDYGYATSEEECLSSNLISYNSSCYSTDWLYNSGDQWTITPYASNLNRVFDVRLPGFVDNSNAIASNRRIRPSVYLKSSVNVISGDGSSSNPYKLEI